MDPRIQSTTYLPGTAVSGLLQPARSNGFAGGDLGLNLPWMGHRRHLSLPWERKNPRVGLVAVSDSTRRATLGPTPRHPGSKVQVPKETSHRVQGHHELLGFDAPSPCPFHLKSKSLLRQPLGQQLPALIPVREAWGQAGAYVFRVGLLSKVGCS